MLVCFLTAGLLPLGIWAFEPPVPETYVPPRPETYMPTLVDRLNNKDIYDDPRPWLTTFGPKQILPAELYEKLTYDIEEMKDTWAEVIGFRAPDVVGKIAPEIKPGKYTYQDLEKYPGFKELMYPELYNRIKPGEPPIGGSIPEFEIISTRQYYYALPIAQATKENQGKTKLDDEGYIIPETWIAGYPYPQPVEPHRAKKIMFNVEKRYLSFEGNFALVGALRGWNKRLETDFSGSIEVNHVKLAGRTQMPPYGWFDERAKERSEFRTFVMGFLAPRDMAGMAQSALICLPPDKVDQLMIYIPSLRRIRKMSATDSQDPVGGQDLIYDDNEGFMQKLSPTRYPYDYKVVEEREYLVTANSSDGAEYMTPPEKGAEWKNVRMERRPMYVMELTQLDRNYVYGKRIFYLDKETFNYRHIDNFDQRGRLYRNFDTNWAWHPEMGAFSLSGVTGILVDHIDVHSGIVFHQQLPAYWAREDVSLAGLVRKGK